MLDKLEHTVSRRRSAYYTDFAKAKPQETLIPHYKMAGDPSPEFDAASLLSSQIYNALDDEKQQLRLVGIQPGARDAPIECTLTICDLKLNPKYEALSYEWAFPGSERSIMLSGKMFMVREICGGLYITCETRRKRGSSGSMLSVLTRTTTGSATTKLG